MEPTTYPDASAPPACLRLTKAELDQRFHVLGRFYELKGGLDPAHPCRDVLEISRVPAAVAQGESLVPTDAGQIAGCDAIFVMMNPGGSEPREPVAAASREDAQLVPTEPDKTQYQVMRLMEGFGWNHVRVLNLSDIRESQSAELHRKLKAFEGNDHRHSIFSSSRRSELPAALARKPVAPIVLAWGVSPKLRPLAELAVSALRAEGVTSVLGLRHPVRRDWAAYYHPLPRNASKVEKWSADAFAHIGAWQRGRCEPNML